MQKIKEADTSHGHWDMRLAEMVRGWLIALRELCAGMSDASSEGTVRPDALGCRDLGDHGVLAIAEHQMVIGISRATLYRSIKTRPTT